MEEIDYLLEQLLGLVLSGDVGKADAGRRGDIDLRAGIAHAEGHRASGTVHHLAHSFRKYLPEDDKEQYREEPAYEEGEKGRGLCDYLGGKLCARLVQTLGQRRVVHKSGLIYLFIVLVGKKDLVILYLYLADILLVDHIHKGAVIGLDDRGFGELRYDKGIEHYKHQQHDAVIVYQWFFRGLFHFFHKHLPLLSV